MKWLCTVLRRGAPLVRRHVTGLERGAEEGGQPLALVKSEFLNKVKVKNLQKYKQKNRGAKFFLIILTR